MSISIRLFFLVLMVILSGGVGAGEQERVGVLPFAELLELRPALRELALPELDEPADQLLHAAPILPDSGPIQTAPMH